MSNRKNNDLCLTNQLTFFILFLLLVSSNPQDILHCQTTGQSLSVDGASGYISLPSNSNLNSFMQITIELWIKPTSFDLGTWNSSEGLVAKGEGANTFYLWLERNSDNQNGYARNFLQFKCNFEFGSVSASTSWHEPGKWYHIAATYDEKNITVYVNGTPEGTIKISAPITINNTQPIFINHHTWNNGYQSSQRMGGLIDEFRLWSRSLTLDEIKSTMNMELSGSEAGLLVYYNFNELTPNGQLKDFSPNAYHGIINGGAHLVAGNAPLQLSAEAIKQQIDRFISQLETSVQELKNQQLNTSGIEQLLLKTKAERSKENFNEAAKLAQQVKNEISNTQEFYQILQRTKTEIVTIQEIGCDVTTAFEQIKSAEDALKKGDLTSAQRFLSQASSIAASAPCGQVNVNDLRALGAKYDSRNIEIRGEVKSIDPVIGQGYRLTIDDGTGVIAIRYAQSAKGIKVGDEIHIQGKYFMNQDQIQASKIEPGSFFTFGRVVLILLILGITSAIYYYRANLAKLLKNFQEAANARPHKLQEQVIAQTISQVQERPAFQSSYIFASPVGAVIAAICFFLPWIRFQCAGVERTASGSEIGGILWLVLVAALLVVGAFFFFHNKGEVQKSKPIIFVCSIVALVIMIVRYVIFMSGENTQYGTIRPQDIGLSIEFGAIGTLIGFVLALFGTIFFKSNQTQSTTAVPKKD